MSTNRRITPPYKGQKGRCAWCGTDDLPKGRKSWCSQKCVDAYLEISDPATIRQAIYERDKGICALCGCDCDAEYLKWSRTRHEVDRLAHWLIHAARWDLRWDGRRMASRDFSLPGRKTLKQFRESLAEKYAPGRWTQGRSSGWDADHIVPVVEGGGECDLSNYRTLCHPCHKIETAKLAARLAEARRIEKRRAVGDLFETAETNQ